MYFVHIQTEDHSKSLIISITRDDIASLTNNDNYRRIASLNYICKIFDNVLLLLYGNEL